ncbi:hypothetical protein D9758_006683 [Tetrapyrgos nigripes]|uniref:Uncharacterized protein n=1 Tax=Tetrapyrgos nigripes TaxID=182062 RepID=A0A8H5GJK8_9AGAR|nr:hypothetical protein D9758_006683 [Tetrapyrgos nigripes]
MMSSSATTSTSVAGQQQILTGTIRSGTKRSKPTLTVHIPETIRVSRISVDLGMLFSGNNMLNIDCFSRSLPRFPTPVFGAQIPVHVVESKNSELSLQRESDYEQCIIIHSTSPFYHPPSPPPFSFSLELMSMACELHEALGPCIDDTTINASLVDCLKGVDEDLFTSPIDVFEEMLYTSTRPYSTLRFPSQHCYTSSYSEYRRHCDIDIPEDVESDELDLSDFADSSDSEAEFPLEDEDEHHLIEIVTTPATPESRPLVVTPAAAPLDKRLVAPFDYCNEEDTPLVGVADRSFLRRYGRIFTTR